MAPTQGSMKPKPQYPLMKSHEIVTYLHKFSNFKSLKSIENIDQLVMCEIITVLLSEIPFTPDYSYVMRIPRSEILPAVHKLLKNFTPSLGSTSVSLFTLMKPTPLNLRRIVSAIKFSCDGNQPAAEMASDEVKLNAETSNALEKYSDDIREWERKLNAIRPLEYKNKESLVTAQKDLDKAFTSSKKAEGALEDVTKQLNKALQSSENTTKFINNANVKIEDYKSTISDLKSKIAVDSNALEEIEFQLVECKESIQSKEEQNKVDDRRLKLINEHIAKSHDAQDKSVELLQGITEAKALKDRLHESAKVGILPQIKEFQKEIELLKENKKGLKEVLKANKQSIAKYKKRVGAQIESIGVNRDNKQAEVDVENAKTSELADVISSLESELSRYLKAEEDLIGDMQKKLLSLQNSVLFDMSFEINDLLAQINQLKAENAQLKQQQFIVPTVPAPPTVQPAFGSPLVIRKRNKDIHRPCSASNSPRSDMQPTSCFPSGNYAGYPNDCQSLLAMSTDPIKAVWMRQSGYVGILLGKIYGSFPGQIVEAAMRNFTLWPEFRTTRNRAAPALRNVIHSCGSDAELRFRETKVLGLLEQVRLFVDERVDAMSTRSNMGLTTSCLPALEALAQLSFLDTDRVLMSQLGSLHAVVEVLFVLEEYDIEEKVRDKGRNSIYLILTNLTFENSMNKSLLCKSPGFLSKLHSNLVSATNALDIPLIGSVASVFRNLSWSASTEIKSQLALRQSHRLLFQSAHDLLEKSTHARKESAISCFQSLRNILKALWNMSGHGREMKADLCASPGMFSFILKCLRLDYSKNDCILGLVESACGVLRNISSLVAVNEQYRNVLRQGQVLPLLLELVTTAPSVNLVSNACVTLWNLSARNQEDQQILIALNAPRILSGLVKSKHSLIRAGASSTLRNLNKSMQTNHQLSLSPPVSNGIHHAQHHHHHQMSYPQIPHGSFNTSNASHSLHPKMASIVSIPSRTIGSAFHPVCNPPTQSHFPSVHVELDDDKASVYSAMSMTSQSMLNDSPSSYSQTNLVNSTTNPNGKDFEGSVYDDEEEVRKFTNETLDDISTISENDLSNLTLPSQIMTKKRNRLSESLVLGAAENTNHSSSNNTNGSSANTTPNGHSSSASTTKGDSPLSAQKVGPPKSTTTDTSADAMNRFWASMANPNVPENVPLPDDSVVSYANISSMAKQHEVSLNSCGTSLSGDEYDDEPRVFGGEGTPSRDDLSVCSDALSAITIPSVAGEAALEHFDFFQIKPAENGNHHHVENTISLDAEPDSEDLALVEKCIAKADVAASSSNGTSVSIDSSESSLDDPNNVSGGSEGGRVKRLVQTFQSRSRNLISK